ncbi:Hypothetical_protein [Hexamita inflata]|uniref:Hypothetical_protein n=1 Tax=Hexamita inflata TaxID=28002 RepID=A0ABP1I837_9EUKA
MNTLDDAIFDFFSCNQILQQYRQLSQNTIQSIVRPRMQQILFQYKYSRIRNRKGATCCYALISNNSRMPSTLLSNRNGATQLQRQQISIEILEIGIGKKVSQLQTWTTRVAATQLSLQFCVLIPIRSSIQLQQAVIVQLYVKSRINNHLTYQTPLVISQKYFNNAKDTKLNTFHITLKKQLPSSYAPIKCAHNTTYTKYSEYSEIFNTTRMIFGRSQFAISPVAPERYQYRQLLKYRQEYSCVPRLQYFFNIFHDSQVDGHRCGCAF